jgi:hypothetical protein
LFYLPCLNAIPLLLLLQVSAVAGAVSLGFMSQTMQAAGEAAAAAAEDRAALAEEGAYPEAAEAAGSSSSGFKSPLLQVGYVICALFVHTCFRWFCKGLVWLHVCHRLMGLRPVHISQSYM